LMAVLRLISADFGPAPQVWTEDDAPFALPARRRPAEALDGAWTSLDDQGAPAIFADDIHSLAVTCQVRLEPTGAVGRYIVRGAPQGAGATFLLRGERTLVPKSHESPYNITFLRAPGPVMQRIEFVINWEVETTDGVITHLGKSRHEVVVLSHRPLLPWTLHDPERWLWHPLVRRIAADTEVPNDDLAWLTVRVREWLEGGDFVYNPAQAVNDGSYLTADGGVQLDKLFDDEAEVTNGKTIGVDCQVVARLLHLVCAAFGVPTRVRRIGTGSVTGWRIRPIRGIGWGGFGYPNGSRFASGRFLFHEVVECVTHGRLYEAGFDLQADTPDGFDTTEHESVLGWRMHRLLELLFEDAAPPPDQDQPVETAAVLSRVERLDDPETVGDRYRAIRVRTAHEHVEVEFSDSALDDVVTLRGMDAAFRRSGAEVTGPELEHLRAIVDGLPRGSPL
jgi:hypothetical protein